MYKMLIPDVFVCHKEELRSKLFVAPRRTDVYKREYENMTHAVLAVPVCTATADTVQTQHCAFVGELLYNVLPHPLHTSHWSSSGILLYGRANNNMWVLTKRGIWGFQNKLLLWSSHFILQSPKNMWRLCLCTRLTDCIIIATNSIPGDGHLGIQVHQPMCKVKQCCNNNSVLPSSHTVRYKSLLTDA